MRLRQIVVLGSCFLSATAASADGKNSSSSSISEQHRIELIRTFNADLFIRTEFPMGKVGLTIKDGKVSPSGTELKQLLAMWGPSVKPGDRAIITQFVMKNNRMHLEINGGPVRKTKVVPAY